MELDFNSDRPIFQQIAEGLDEMPSSSTKSPPES